MLEKVYESHKKWINTTLKFGCTKYEAEDIVGEMYLIIGKMLNKGLDISYNNEVNYYYIYKTLKTTFLQLENKKNRLPKTSIDLCSRLSIWRIHRLSRRERQSRIRVRQTALV